MVPKLQASVTLPLPPEGDEGVEGPPTEKHFKHLEKVLQQKVKEGLEKTAHLPPGKAELDHYFSSLLTMSEGVDPISFWTENEANYPLLSSLACDMLCIPASSVPVEQHSPQPESLRVGSAID